MKLYDFPQSPNCRRVRMYVAEKGLTVSLQPTDLFAGQQASPEFLRRNPFGAVPILELDNGAIIPESLAIIEYLEELHPEPSLLGHDPFERALVRAWDRRCELGVFLQATRRFFHSSPFFAARVRQNPHVVEEAGQVLKNRLELINDQLQHRDWIVGSFSLADITLFVGIEFAAGTHFMLDPTWAHLGRWYETMKKRPSMTA
jgi:glutathione S-transferase